jgi:hypothetical protein
MLKYLIFGSCLGVAIPQYVSNKNYNFLYLGIYKPHKDFFNLRKNRFQNDNAVSEKDYSNYIKSVCRSFYMMAHYFLIGKSQEFLEKKQKKCFKLIENFEFVKETTENMEYVIENIAKEIRRAHMLKAKDNFYGLIPELENSNEPENVSADHTNLEYLKQIQELSTDDYEKYLLSQSVIPKDEFMKNMNPEFFKQKEIERFNLLQSYENSLNEHKNTQSYDSMRNEFMKMHNKVNQITKEKSIETLRKKPDHKNQDKLDKIEKEQMKEKSHKVKAVEKEIEDLKKIFGNK